MNVGWYCIIVLCALQGVRDAPREGSRKKWTFSRQSQQPGTQRGGGGFPTAALQTSHLRGRIKQTIQYKYIFFMYI